MNISLSPEFYTHSIIISMIEEFSDFISVKHVFTDQISLTIDVKEEYKKSESLIINTFLNNIFELSIQDIMNNEN